ncbi:MAG: AraC family transcriptional regulator, partial [Myxococcota bacterium]
MVAPPGASALTTLGPLEAFDVANRFLAARGRPPLYRLVLASVGPVAVTSVGVELRATPVAELDPVHTLIVGGGPELPEHALDAALVREVGRLSARATRVVSVCGGAFVLGALGLLDGRRCTTHWLWVDALRERFPEARVEPDAIYTADGPIWTSAGVTAGVDLALQLIRS